MTSPASRVLAFSALLLCAASALRAQSIDTLALRAHTRFLASDLLGGRDTGSPGERYAAAYIESQLRMLGLQGPFDGEYRQPIPLRSFTVEPASRVTVHSGGDTASFAPPAGFVAGPAGRNALRGFSGEVMLVGDPATASAATTPLRGKVLAVLGTLGADAAGILPAWERAGVTGIVYLVPDSAQFALLARSRGSERLYVDAPIEDPVWQPSLPSIVAGPELTAALLRGAPIPQQAFRGEPFDPVPLGRTIDVEIQGSERAIPAANVGGLLPASDRERNGEVIVYTAHYDHLGTVPGVGGGDSIYNGFSDNAAGVAMLLTIARALVEEPPGPAVLFLFLTGEERGLLGASWAAASPPVPLEQISALINLDAGAPPVPPVSWRIAGGEGQAVGRLAADVAAEQGWTASLSAASPNSDYWPFLTRGVPAIFLIPGAEWEGVTPAERDALRQRWDRYHHPDDEWASDFPFAGLARYADFALRVGRAVAEQR